MKKLIREVEIFFRRAARRLRGKPADYFRVGKCRRCGECCRNVVLNLDGKKIKTEEDFKKLAEEDSIYHVFVPKSVNPDGVIIFQCTKLDENNLCTVYNSRPSVCVEFPDLDLLRCGGDVIAECGYYLVPPEDFRKVLKKSI